MKKQTPLKFYNIIKRIKEPFKFRKNFSRENADSYKEEIVLNSINILMKRAIKGLYIYAIDSKLNDYLLKLKRDMKL